MIPFKKKQFSILIPFKKKTVLCMRIIKKHFILNIYPNVNDEKLGVDCWGSNMNYKLKKKLRKNISVKRTVDEVSNER